MLRDMIEADERLLARVNRAPKGERAQPSEVGDALKTCSKQFQLWDVKREELDAERPKGEPVLEAGAPRPIEAAGPKFERVLSESTHAMTQFVAASVVARKAFVGLRALKRQALRKPYKPS
jgi:hypothetical protein